MEFLPITVESFFPEELQRACLLCFHRVLNTVVYNDRDSKSLISCKYGGIVASPMKFRNFEQYMMKAKTAFTTFFNPTSVITLFDLIVSRYLPIKSIELWNSDPEAFIEQEDDTFVHEFESDRESSMSYLAFNILEKLLNLFPVVCAKRIKKYIDNITAGNAQGYNIIIQDAIYNSIEMMPKIYSQDIIMNIPNLKPETFLTFLEGQINTTQTPMEGNILKRRYIILITKWLEFIQKEDIIKYLANIIQIMTVTDQLVLKYQSCIAIKLLLDFLSGEHLKEKRFESSEAVTSKEKFCELEKLSNIERIINYEELLTNSTKVIIDVLTSFKSAKIIWVMINLLTLLIQKCQYRCNENVLRVLEIANFELLFTIKYELIEEALIDMCKALIISFPSSIIMLRLCLNIIDRKLSVIFDITYRRVETILGFTYSGYSY